MEHVHDQFVSGIQVFGGLAMQVAREVADPAQFLDPNRTTQLIKNGVNRLRAIAISMSTIEAATANIGNNLHSVVSQYDVFFATSEAVPVTAVVFPSASRIHYFPKGSPPEVLAERIGRVFWIVSTTMCNNKESSKLGYPTEGYKDHTGEIVPFATRDPESQVQHGAILVDNSRGVLQIVDYPRLLEERGRDLNPGEIIIEANWYMDSNNQQSVAHRTNLLKPNTYNCIGQLGFRRNRLSDLYFTLNVDPTSVERILTRTPNLPLFRNRDITMIEVAAMCNVLANRFNAAHWAVAGLEFHGGGTFFPSSKQARVLEHRDYFNLTI